MKEALDSGQVGPLAVSSPTSEEVGDLVLPAVPSAALGALSAVADHRGHSPGDLPASASSAAAAHSIPVRHAVEVPGRVKVMFLEKVFTTVVRLPGLESFPHAMGKFSLGVNQSDRMESLMDGRGLEEAAVEKVYAGCVYFSTLGTRRKDGQLETPFYLRLRNIFPFA